MTAADITKRQQAIAQMKDAVAQAQALEDWFFEGEIILKEEKRDEAIAIFKAVLAVELIEYDLSQEALYRAEKQLIEMGEISLPPLAELHKKYQEKFCNQDQAMQLLSVAKSIWGDWRMQNWETADYCFELVLASESLKPLSRKDYTFKIMLKTYIK